MKKFSIYLMILICSFISFGCSCNKDEKISKEDAINILKETIVEGNVEVITNTETNINGAKTISTQRDVYYNDVYYHISDDNNIHTQTWYGSVDNVLYAFYYTKNGNTEVKNSSRIEPSQLEAAKKQPNSIIKSFFDEKGNLLEVYNVTGYKNNRTYTIQVNASFEEEIDTHTIVITDGKIIKITKNSNIADDTIKITYLYNYDVDEIVLPTLNEYPLIVNG